MSEVFKGPGRTKIQQIEPEPERIEVVEEEAEEVRKRERKKLQTTGRRATVLSGIMSALKRRLGE